MSPDQIVIPMLQAPLFSGLGPRELKVLALSGEIVEFDDGDVVIDEREPADAGFLVLSGEVVAIDGDAADVRAERLSAGTIVGEMSMLIETEHGMTVIARGSVRALRFTRAAVHELMVEHPEIARHFVDRIKDRLLVVANELRRIDQALGTDPDWPGEDLPNLAESGLQAPHRRALH